MVDAGRIGLASPGEMVKAIASVLGVSEAQVVQHDRNLAIAGVRPVGGRGRSAAKMTPRDVANLLISVVAGSDAKKTVEALNDYASLKVSGGSVQEFQLGETIPDVSKEEWTDNSKHWDLGSVIVPHLQDLGANHTLLDALTCLLESETNETLSKEIRRISLASNAMPFFLWVPLTEVTLRSPWPRAQIILTLPGLRETKSYGLPDRDYPALPFEDIVEAENYLAAIGDLRQTRTFTLKTIIELGKLLRT